MVNYEELNKIAALAKLSLEGEDMAALAADMSSIIEFADSVSRAELPVLPAAASEPTALRADDVSPSLPVGDVLKNAHERSELFFLARGKGLTAE